MLKKIIGFLFLLIALGIPFAYRYALSYGSCIPIQGSLFQRHDYERSRNIVVALQHIEQYSPEDYKRVCARASAITITTFEDQLVPTVPIHALGAFFPDQDDLTAKGVIKIDREVALSFMSQLERVLVHEACHAFQIQMYADFSEPPCYLRGHAYVMSRPEEPLAERSAEFIEKTGRQFYVYCSERGSTASRAQGECVFINYTTESKRMCAHVFLRKNDKDEIAKEVCAEVEPMEYQHPSFELAYPPGTALKSHQFGFSPVGF
ncbi:MAG: hypothetical protein A3I44_04560 [Candidatus Sungbacteria bacterium RIFCSPLOWO2_02_FULL_51_17]|uniref:Uncharacterized protein n=1 Tax=Candidatus Sungbacteria bacterium RIFCSPHIGHO2_02_FULL_51_29 TaxID=1802273 RepID=A0A1G2KX17_9BACT|nr:MAG: hypothetical protein A2676_02210 [Candidatus Sungbacteria bacterium RIFCSPHIGHO2_01_FULL_51_22]OHA03957.1 MAG: hypothetical protein A3C16_01010 [Candidatus Sungbacteria bacterium RIFCSPHIGHO2_02_FULL_51_29]OHA05669.1 MAG: hypothetical protein A3B29_03975 [Candidatus Sungbacteria bacterium RIFCSPLOWO2_01_FULL_51_34]OHA11773.1 MAG: hypothetical protein A3I44_04560 [Candidatus Sungbacteria bacterium RIFCSPLOWO2_02_FULL_51_17]